MAHLKQGSHNFLMSKFISLLLEVTDVVSPYTDAQPQQLQTVCRWILLRLSTAKEVLEGKKKSIMNSDKKIKSDRMF